MGAAAYNYFGKPLHDLDLAQMAYLAALPKGPSNYHPIRHKPAAIARRNWILGEMANLGWVSRSAAAAASSRPGSGSDPGSHLPGLLRLG